MLSFHVPDGSTYDGLYADIRECLAKTIDLMIGSGLEGLPATLPVLVYNQYRLLYLMVIQSPYENSGLIIPLSFPSNWYGQLLVAPRFCH